LSALAVGSLVAAAVACLGWALLIARVDTTTRRMRRLPTTRIPEDGARPRVTAVLAARDEAHAIEHTVRSLLGQEGVDIDVIAVDDSSQDGTREILERLAGEEERLTVLENTKLPKGWVAKNYALELGQGRAEGDFLLFTDADVAHGRRSVFHAVEVMEQETLDHLALHPRLEAGSWIEALALPLYFLLCEFRFLDPKATEAESGVGAGIGAFNLVRTEAYRLRGTHARIRGAVLDDRALGKMMRFDGGRGTVMRAVSQVRMRPYRTFGDLYRGIKKGALSTMGNSALATVVGGLVLLAATVGPVVLLASGIAVFAMGDHGWFALPAGLALALPTVGLLRARTLVRFEPIAALLYPLGAVVIAAAALHAGLVFGVRGHVEWRGRLYSRRALRRSLDEMF
jgi:glycosyltransferase involved in cell wall biosynthesis